jgi:hypothetical protein
VVKHRYAFVLSFDYRLVKTGCFSTPIKTVFMKKNLFTIAGMIALLLSALPAAAQWNNLSGQAHLANPNAMVGIGTLGYTSGTIKLQLYNITHATGMNIYSEANASQTYSPTGLYLRAVNQRTTPSYPMGIDATATESRGGHCIGIYGSGNNTATAGGAVGIWGNAQIWGCNPTGTYPASKYAIGVYGAGYSYGGCVLPPTASAGWAMYADGYLATTSGLYTLSDSRTKTDVKTFSSGLDMVRRLRPTTYQYTHEGRLANANLPAGQQYGFLAQELEQVLPGAVREMPVFVNKEKDNPRAAETEQYKSIRYDMLIPVLTRAIQEQQETIEALKTEVAALRQKQSQATPASPVAAKLLSLTPNPASGQAIVRYALPAGTRQAELLLLDLQGKMLKKVALAAGTQVTMPLSQVPAGLYLCSLVIDGQERDTQKLVVQ